MRLPALDTKLLRDVSRLRGQIVTIALVLAGGITCFISLRGTVLALDDARRAYYDAFRFADVFATVERAPESIAARVESIPGVSRIQTRISKEVTLPLEGMERPAYGRLLSLPAGGEPATNAVRLERGRLPSPGKDDEAAVLQAFADAHGLRPGDRVPVVLGGKLRRLRAVGVVRSPEYVYAIRPGALINDPQRYAVLWMDRAAVAAAFELDGAFNEISLRLQPGASEAAVREALDRVLRPYGTDGAYGRSSQVSNRVLTSELGQLYALAGMVPLVFLGVAAFLMNMVLGRLIVLQRPEIAALKAIGYTNLEVGRHYLGLSAIVLVPGAAAGVAGGWLLGRSVLALYGALFQFPGLAFRLTPGLLLSAIGVSALAAVSGAAFAVRGAVRLPPAEAMRPAAPARYRRSPLERLGLSRLIGPAGMMVVREIARRPLRSALSSAGIAGAVALMIFGHFGADSLASYLEGTLRREQRQDLAVRFAGPLGTRAVSELGHAMGVVMAEGQRAIPIRLRHEQRWRDTALIALPPGATLRRLIDRSGAAVAIPEDGLLLTRELGEILDLRAGDRAEVEVHEGDRRTVCPVIAGFVDETVGLQAYAQEPFAKALEGDTGAVSSALLRVDPPELAGVERQLRRSPKVIDVSDIGADVQRLRDMNGAMMDIWTAISITLSASIVFGVVYNNARIALAVRSRDLASLRILGFTRREIAAILVGQLAIEVAVAVPIGLWLGKVWGAFFMGSVDRETFRWTVVVEPRTYALAAAVALLAGAASVLWVRRSLDRLDLIAVLKARE